MQRLGRIGILGSGGVSETGEGPWSNTKIPSGPASVSGTGEEGDSRDKPENDGEAAHFIGEEAVHEPFCKCLIIRAL